MLPLLLLFACAPEAEPPGEPQAPPTTAECLADPTCTDVLVVAHRAFHADAPENSLLAVEATAAIGVAFAEVDVRHTSDGALVIMHDDTVDRTTDGTGEVAQLSAADVAALRLDDGTSSVPTFAEVLAVAVRTGLGVYVDTKTDRVDLVTAEILAAGAEGLALVRKDAGSLGPALEAGLHVLAPVSTIDELDAVAPTLPADALIEISATTPDADLVAAVRDYGLRAQQDVFIGDGAWVLQGSADGWAQFLAAGVQLPQSEYPDALLAAVQDGTLPAHVP